MLFLPPVRLRKSNWTRLMQLAFDSRLDHHPVAPLLRSEIHRAIVLDEHEHWEDIAELNVWVKYRVDGQIAESRLLVHPDDYATGDLRLSVLSPVGAALIGIRAGDRMLFAGTEDHMHCVTPLVVGRKAKPPVQARASRRQPAVCPAVGVAFEQHAGLFPPTSPLGA